MVPSSVNRISYNGNGVTTEFSYPFKILSASDVKVMTVSNTGVETVLTSDYYVDTNASKVYYPGYAPGAEEPESEQPPVLPTGWRLVIYRNVPVNQLTTLDTHWPFSSIEGMSDKLTIICQQFGDLLDRSFKVSEASTISTNITVPIAAGRSFRWNSAGTALETTADPADVYPLCTAALTATQAARDALLLRPGYIAVEGDLTNIDLVANNKTNVDTVATNITNVNNVGGNITKVVAVANDLTNIDTVKADLSNIDVVAGDHTYVVALGAISTEIAGVYAIRAAVTNVNSNAANINSVAGDLTNINACAGDLTNIDAAPTHAATATTKASEAATSASTASTKAGEASTSATSAASSASAAATSETNASSSASAAATSETNAGNSATAAASSASAAATSETNAATSATNAGGSATSASNSATTATTQAGLSKQWAIGEPSEPSGGSAKYWAGQAAAGQVQADMSVTDTTQKSYILNKELQYLSGDSTHRTVTDTEKDAWNAKADTTALSAHTTSTSNPHSVTKSQVGLGSVANTGDSDTPVSGGTTKFTTGGAYTELAKKVDVAQGSANAYKTLATNASGNTTTIAAPMFNKRDIITTSGTYTVPVTGWYKITCKGGGGGGSGARSEVTASDIQAGSGGSEGGITRTYVKLTAGATLTCTIGAGGTGGTTSNSTTATTRNGSIGGNTTVYNASSSLVAQANGGSPGIYAGPGCLSASLSGYYEGCAPGQIGICINGYTIPGSGGGCGGPNCYYPAYGSTARSANANTGGGGSGGKWYNRSGTIENINGGDGGSGYIWFEYFDPTL